MEHFGLIQFVIIVGLSVLIVFLLHKMADTNKAHLTTHYRCGNNFYHIFTQTEIEYMYGKNKSIYLCPKTGCGGILRLYEYITDEEYKELEKLKYFED